MANPFLDPEKARAAQAKSLESRRRNEASKRQAADERAILARMTLTDRLRWEVQNRWLEPIVQGIDDGLTSRDAGERRQMVRLVLEWTLPKPAQGLDLNVAPQPSAADLERMTAELREITDELDA